MGWVVNDTSWPLYPRERPGTHRIGGWVGLRVGLDWYRKSCPHRESIPDRPTRSESLHQLSYPGPYIYIYIYMETFCVFFGLASWISYLSVTLNHLQCLHNCKKIYNLKSDIIKKGCLNFCHGFLCRYYIIILKIKYQILRVWKRCNI